MENEIKKINSKKKEFLYSYVNADKQITVLQEQIDVLDTAKQRAKSTVYIDELDDMIAKTKSEIETLECNKIKVLKNIMSISNAEYKSILTKRYIDGKTFGKIAKEMGFSSRQIERRHGEALSLINVV